MSRRPDYTGEQELLLLCARTELDAEQRDKLRTLAAGGMDWSQLVMTAVRHQSLPLLSHHLGSTCADLVPSQLLAQLSSRCARSAERNLRLTRLLLEYLDKFSAAGIPAIPLKGPTLAEALYGDLSLRHFNDLDVLVPRKAAFAARDLVVREGLVVVPNLQGARARSYVRSDCHWCVADREDTFLLEIHWAVRERVYAFPYELGHVKDRLDCLQILGREVPTLPPSDLLLILSVHGAKHHWERVKFLTDIAQWLQKSPILDWGGLFSAADRLHARRMVLVALSLTQTVLGIDLPPEAKQEISRDSELGPLVEELAARLFAEVDRNAADHLHGMRLYLRMRERRSDRARFILGQVVTPTPVDWKAVPLPDPLFPAYYLLRPARLLWEYTTKKSRGNTGP